MLPVGVCGPCVPKGNAAEENQNQRTFCALLRSPDDLTATAIQFTPRSIFTACRCSHVEVLLRSVLEGNVAVKVVVSRCGLWSRRSLPSTAEDALSGFIVRLNVEALESLFTLRLLDPALNR